MLHHRACRDFAEQRALETETLDHALQSGSEHLLVAEPRVGAVRPRKRNAAASHDGYFANLRSDQHRLDS